jgi:hypothetical protein
VPGVQKVKIMGEQNQKIFVEISYQRLATLGLGAQTLFSAIASHNDVTPSGFVEANGPRVYLRLDGAVTDIDSVRSIPLPVPGRTLTVGDVAEVRRGYEDPPTFQIREAGEPALILGVEMHKRYNGLTLGNDLAAEVSQLQSELPVGITFTQISDQAAVIKAAINEFMVKFFAALGVVILVSLLTLGFRVGIVVAAAVPLTLGAVFLIMLVTGRDFDRITLGALILSLGLLDLHGGTDAHGHSGHDRGLPTCRLRAVDGRRIRGKHLLDCGVLAAGVVVRGRDLHALHGGEAPAEHSGQSARARVDLRHEELRTVSSSHPAVCGLQMGDAGCHRRIVHRVRRGHGDCEEAVLPEFGPNRADA